MRRKKIIKIVALFLVLSFIFQMQPALRFEHRFANASLIPPIPPIPPLPGQNQPATQRPTEPEQPTPTQPETQRPTEPMQPTPTQPETQGPTEPVQPAPTETQPDHEGSTETQPEETQAPTQPPMYTPAPTTPIVNDPLESSELIIETNDENHIVISGPSLGEGNEITIKNAPLGISFLRQGDLDEMFILFPDEVEVDEIQIITPTTEWAYEFFTDTEGNFILVLLPPDVDLDEVLEDPLNPQPDESFFATDDEDIDDDQLSSTEPDETVTSNEEDDTDDDLLEEEVSEDDTSVLPTGLLANSLALLGVIFLKCGHVLLNKNKVD